MILTRQLVFGTYSSSSCCTFLRLTRAKQNVLPLSAFPPRVKHTYRQTDDRDATPRLTSSGSRTDLTWQD